MLCILANSHALENPVLVWPRLNASVHREVVSPSLNKFVNFFKKKNVNDVTLACIF